MAESRNVRQVINTGHFNGHERCKDKCSTFLSSHAAKIFFKRAVDTFLFDNINTLLKETSFLYW